jgi:hypothetical protein
VLTTTVAEQPPAVNDLLAAALDYRRRGWAVIPVRGKHAATRWKRYQAHPPGEKTLRRLFRRHDITGLAALTGRASGGLAVRDFDRAAAYEHWASRYPLLAAALPTVKTARGFHVYGQLDEDAYAELGDGELRADPGHYVLLPPSRHPDGPAYAWRVSLPTAGLPALHGSLTRPQQPHAGAADPVPPSTSSTNIAWWTCLILGCLPTGPGQRNRRVFEFARRLKGAKPDATPAELRHALREWHRRALPHIRTKDFDESWSDFTTAWERVRRPAGQSLAAAVAAADDVPPAVERLGYDGALRRLAALCWQLARQWGHKPFPLGCEVAEDYLNTSARQAARLLKTLRFDKVLERVKKGTKASGQASEYLFTATEGGGDR